MGFSRLDQFASNAPHEQNVDAPIDQRDGDITESNWDSAEHSHFQQGCDDVEIVLDDGDGFAQVLAPRGALHGLRPECIFGDGGYEHGRRRGYFEEQDAGFEDGGVIEKRGDAVGGVERDEPVEEEA